MIVKIKRYIARIKDFTENSDGSVAISERESEIIGERIRNETVLKQIPRSAKLLEHGYVVREYEIDKDELEDFLLDHAKRVK